MVERSRRRRLLAAPVILVALAAAVGAPASASRGKPGGGGALAVATAVQINAAAFVTAEATGDQVDRASGTSLTVPGTLKVRTADSAAETRVRTELGARATTGLAGVRLKGSTARVAQLTDQVLTDARARVSAALLAACGSGVRVEADVVVEAALRAVAHAGAGTPFGALEFDRSVEAQLRAEIRAVLDSEDLTGAVCDSRLGRLPGRIVAAIESTVREAIDAHLSISLRALRSACELGRHAGTARTELLVHERTAAVLGLEGELDGDGVLVKVAPNTGVDLGGGVRLVLNEQQRANRPGRDAQIVVNGAVLRIGGTAVVTLASSRCELRGDVVIDTETDDRILTVTPEARIETHLEARVEAGVEVQASTAGSAGGGPGVAWLEVDATVWAAGRL